MTLGMLHNALQRLEQAPDVHKNLLDTAAALVAIMAQKHLAHEKIVDMATVEQGQAFIRALEAAGAIQDEFRSLLVHPTTTTAINVVRITLGLSS